MSNFSIFNQHYLETLVHPFMPAIAPRITPIRYEAITPDVFLLLFRTADEYGREQFYVSYETDHVDSMAGAQCAVEDWHGSFDSFLPLAESDEEADDENLKAYVTVSREPYYCMVARVDKPLGKGYWSSHITLMPGDTIDTALAGLPADQQDMVRKGITDVLRHKHPDSAASFADSYAVARQDTVVDGVNMTQMAVTVYVKPDGGYELFYNFVKP